MLDVKTYNNLKNKLSESGLKVTKKRLAILKVFASNPGEHLDAEEIYAKAKEYDSDISLATVYRNIRFLINNKVIDAHDFNKNKTSYEAMAKTQHDHLVDIEDSSIIEFFDKDIVKIIDRVSKKYNYDIQDYKLELYGKKKGS